MTLRAKVDFAGEGVNFGAGVDGDKCAIDVDKRVQIALLRSFHGYFGSCSGTHTFVALPIFLRYLRNMCLQLKDLFCFKYQPGLYAIGEHAMGLLVRSYGTSCFIAIPLFILIPQQPRD